MINKTIHIIIAIFILTYGHKALAQPFIIKKISVEGNQLIDDNKIILIGQIPINKKYTKNKSLKKAGTQGVNQIKEYYAQQGYFNTDIRLHFLPFNKAEKKKSGYIHLKYKIKEKDPCKIENISIQVSNENLKKKSVLTIKKYHGKIFSEDTIFQITKDLNNMFFKEKYLGTTLEHGEIEYNKEKTKASFTYKINHPYKYEMYFYGNKYFSRSDIIRILKNETLTSSSKKIRLTLIKSYKNKGFAEIKISDSERTNKNGTTRSLILNIKEGPRVKIHTIKVESPLKKSLSYKKFIMRHSSNIIKKGYYNEEDLKKGVDNLIANLNNNGYLRAQHILTQWKYINKKKSFGVANIRINEGPLTRIKEIKFNGTKSFSQKTLIQQSQLKIGDPLKDGTFGESIPKLNKFYRKHGFLEFKVLNDPSIESTKNQENLIQTSTDLTQAFLHFNIFEGDQIKISSINVTGNNFTKNSVILKSIDLKIGDILTNEKIISSQEALFLLGIFSRVNIIFDEKAKGPLRTVTIQVQEATPGTFKIGAGVTNENELTGRLYLGASYNNIKGTGRAVNGRLNYKVNLIEEHLSNEVRLTTGYTEPHLFGSRWQGKALSILERALRDQDSLSDRYINSEIIDFAIERNLNRKINFSWTLWNYTQRQLEVRPRPNSGLEAETLSQLHIGQTGPRLTFEYRDSSFNPTKGHYSQLSTTYASPYLGSSGSVHFLRFEGNFRYYIDLGRGKWVWANSYSTGYIKNLLGAKHYSGIPYSSFFFLGGPNSLRGFGGSNPLERVPSSDAIGGHNQFQGTELIRTKSVLYHLIRSELRYPITGIFSGVVFYDAGEVNMSNIPQRLQWRQSYGLGLRVNSPIGPISIDYARKVHPLNGIGPNNDQNESEYRFHLSIGTF